NQYDQEELAAEVTRKGPGQVHGVGPSSCALTARFVSAQRTRCHNCPNCAPPMMAIHIPQTASGSRYINGVRNRSRLLALASAKPEILIRRAAAAAMAIREAYPRRLKGAGRSAARAIS